MADLEKAVEAQVRNIETRTGMDRSALVAAIRGAGLAKHMEMLAWAKAQWGLGHGDANLLARLSREGTEGPAPASAGDPLDAIYAGPKAGLRAVHERLMADITTFGAFEVAPKIGYVSLRRAKQFAMLGPKNARQLRLGINLRVEVRHLLVTAEKPGGMCHWTALLETPDQVDAALVAVVRQAFDAAA
jgi:hypothetical protein